MRIHVITLFPELYKPFAETSLISRAAKQGLVDLEIQSLLSVCAPKERVDGHTFGHGHGMVIKPTIVERALEAHEAQRGRSCRIFFSPRGTKVTQQTLKKLYASRAHYPGGITLLPARYEGMDARIESEYADHVFSIGDVVLMGGDLPAMMLIEGLLRFVPGVVGNQDSVTHDSFSGPLVDYPEYTEPVIWRDREVPPVLRSGNHQAQQAWRTAHALQETVVHHFGWIQRYSLSPAEKALIYPQIPKHYAALLHVQVLLPDGREGTTSVTSIDIHDIARSARTYGIEHSYVVTPLTDQQQIVQTLLNFWKTGPGVTYNPHRHEAVNRVSCLDTLDAVITKITKQEGVAPVIVATSARETAPEKTISYFDQERVWSHNRPVLILFGTGSGLAPSVIEQAEYILLPITGLTPFNHLSVRSAAAIVFDRWLGISPNMS